ncbi:unnamed protein product [Spirodela intermedia]|uniref:Uncharacterized protein n=1 Tax=Spirodela intermedia TaxID=51605 RepID=A0A7I8K7M2_SPIIN|nr:unnamed protein product [Spirodela intermedia]
MGRRVISGGCHPAEQKNGDFAALRQLWRLVFQRIVLFPMTACSSINRK